MDTQKRMSIFKKRHAEGDRYEAGLISTSEAIGHFYPYELFNTDDAIELAEEAAANN
jgi:hypothetical protein